MTLTNIGSFLCLWTTVSTVTFRYPRINTAESLICECPDHQCQKVFWYRYLQHSDSLEFLVFSNSANMAQYHSGVNKTFYKTYVTSRSDKAVFSLRISGLQKNDAGLYSCILLSQNNKQDHKDLMPAGYYIRPGETPPTTASPTVKQTTKVVKPYLCKTKTTKDCTPYVLWPIVSVLLCLALSLIGTLFYFSRLPKKCRHQFAKKF